MTSVRLPAAQFYWAVLDLSPLRSTPARRWRLGSIPHRQLGFLFEPVLPVLLDSVQAAYARVDATRVLACGMDRHRVNEHGQRATTLGPESVPEWLGVGTLADVSRLNLLTRDCLPCRARRARRLAGRLLLGTLVTTSTLVTVGAARREGVAREQSAAARAAVDEAYEAALGPPQGSLSRHAQLQGTLRSVRARRTTPAQTSPHEAVATLQAALRALPRDVPVRVDSLVVSEEAARLEAAATDTKQAEALLSSIGAIPGWALAQPTVSTRDSEVRVSARLQRVDP